MDTILCSKCNKKKCTQKFKVMNSGKTTKICLDCRIKSKLNLMRNNCDHGLQKAFCIVCKGNQICFEHNVKPKQKAQCKSCNGSTICTHNKQKHHCKLCSDPLILTKLNWIKNTKRSDKKKNRYDEENHITDKTIDILFEKYKTCYYNDCNKQLQYIEYNDSLGTIERLNNEKGHIITNCVIACRTCNLSKKSFRI